MSEELEKLTPRVQTITLRGEEIQLSVIKVGKISEVMRLVQPFVHMLPKPGDNPKVNPIDIPALVFQHADQVVSLAVLLTDRPREWINDLDLDEMVDLTSRLFEVNLDFFIQRVLPSVLRAMALMADGLKEKGLTGTGEPPSKG